MAKKKVPKTIAGVKVPKPLRRGLRDLAASQNGRKALTEALDAAAAALPGPEVAAKAGKGGASPSDTAATAAALQDAARSFTDALKRRGQTQTPPVTTPPSAATH